VGDKPAVSLGLEARGSRRAPRAATALLFFVAAYSVRGALGEFKERSWDSAGGLRSDPAEPVPAGVF
jgi:hypothetical protein